MFLEKNCLRDISVTSFESHCITFKINQFKTFTLVSDVGLAGCIFFVSTFMKLSTKQYQRIRLLQDLYFLI